MTGMSYPKNSTIYHPQMLYLICMYRNTDYGKELTAMPESHVKFHSLNGKRRILIVDDEMINREMLGHILSDKY